MPDPLTLQTLFIQDRKRHLKKDVVPLLDDGIHVFTHRYYLSTLAYGILETRFRPSMLLTLQDRIIRRKLVEPLVTYVLDVEPDVIIARMRSVGIRGNQHTSREKQANIRLIYQTLAQRTDLGEIRMIDGNQPPSIVASTIWHDLKKRLPEPPVL